MTRIKLATLLTPTLLSTVAFNAWPDAKVLNRYPACDYEVLGSTTAHQRLEYHFSSSRQAKVDEEFQELMARVVEEAEAANAQGIAIIDKKVKATDHDKATIRVEAEFIGACKNAAEGTGEATPYNAQGKRQQSVAMGSYTFEYSITIDPNRGKAKVVKTDLGDNVSVGPESGLYGLPMGASKQQMLDKFGTPTFELALSEDAQLIAYGRDHWLVFKNDTLAEVTYGSSPLSGTFINHLPFDDRFDDRQWRITPKLYKGTEMTAKELAELSTTLSKKGTTLNVHTETYLARNQKEKTVKVTGFTLTDDSVPVSTSVPVAMKHSPVLNSLADKLNTANSNSIALDDLPFDSFGRSKPDRDKQHHLYSATTLIETVGKSISKVYVSPGFITSSEPDDAAWQFGDFYFGQSEDEALAVAGDNAFYFNNMLEYEQDNYTAKIYLERRDDSYQVYSMEISVY